MTPYEYVDLAASYHEIALTALMCYFSIFTAYLVAAYLVGSTMNKFQVIAVTGLFLVMELFMTWGVWTYFNMGREYRKLAGEYTTAVSPGDMALVLLIIGVVAGLRFMWDIRHPKPD